jgi:hypothetical protein
MDTPETNDKPAQSGGGGTTAIAVINQPKQTDGGSSRPALSVLKLLTQFAAFVRAALAARPRLSRATVLAFSIALAAAAGSLVGALAAVAFVRPTPAAAPTVIANAQGEALARLMSEMTAIRSGIERLTQSSNAEFARVNERVERVEKAQNEPAAKIARLADAVQKLEGRIAGAAAPDVTGSIVQKQAGVATPKQDDRPPVVTGWVLRDIFDGAALVESRHGLYEVIPGANLPGLGRVERIQRQGGRWVVVTPKGLIVSAR